MSKMRGVRKTGAPPSAQPLLETPAPPKPSYVRGIPLYFILAILLLFFFIVIVLVTVDANKDNAVARPPSQFTVGGSAVFTAPIAFIDDISIRYLYETMAALQTNCDLASPVVPLVLGSAATTAASWTAAKAQLEPVCDFYGLYSMEQRAGALEGPLDICYAYASVGFQIVQVYYNNSLPFDFLGQLTSAYEVAYPLRMYWDRSTFTSYDVAIDFLNQANAYILAVDAFVSGGGSIQAPSIQPYQSAFCNKYFGQDDLAQYNSLFQPWLAFPFEGLIQKLADTAIATPLSRLLGPIDFTPGTEFKAAYAIGSQYIGDDRIELFSAALLGGLDIQVLTSPPSVALPAIKQSLYAGVNLNISLVPVFVFGTFTDDPSFYSAFNSEGASILIGFTENNNQQTQAQLNENLATTIQSALGARFMSALDFATTHPYEITFGPSYVAEKFVSDIITLCIGTQVNAQSTEASDIFNTFSMKNTAVFISPSNILDIGGRLTQAQALAAFNADGTALGVLMPPFSIQLTDSTPLGGNLSAAAEILGQAPPAPPPPRFDWRDVRPECLPPTINQGSCNNCWAIASTRSVSVRACIDTPGMTYAQFMSVFHVATCANVPQGKDGCDPQMPQTAYTFMTGDVATQQCMPTVMTGAAATGCQQTCVPGGGSLADVSGIIGGSYVRYDNPTDIKTSLVTEGPLAVGFSVPVNFKQVFPTSSPNPNGIYTIDPAQYVIGGHMVMLVGYDDTAPTPYWIVQNSWGSTQGAGGYLKLQQDRNGLLAKSAMWPDKYAWSAMPRPRVSATTPSAVFFSRAAAANPAAPRPLPTVYTSTLGCPTLVVNTNQSTRQANLQGCPNSAGTLTTTTSAVKTSGGHVIGAASGAKPAGWILVAVSLLAACLY